MFLWNVPVPPGYVPEDHGWEPYETAGPAYTCHWLRWRIPLRLPQVLGVLYAHAPDGRDVELWSSYDEYESAETWGERTPQEIARFLV